VEKRKTNSSVDYTRRHNFKIRVDYSVGGGGGGGGQRQRQRTLIVCGMQYAFGINE